MQGNQENAASVTRKGGESRTDKANQNQWNLGFFTIQHKGTGGTLQEGQRALALHVSKCQNATVFMQTSQNHRAVQTEKGSGGLWCTPPA